MEKKRLSNRDKWFIVAGILLIVAGVAGILLGVVGALVEPSVRASVTTVLGSIAIVFLTLGALLGYVLQIMFRSRDRKERKLELLNEQDRLLRILNDQEM